MGPGETELGASTPSAPSSPPTTPTECKPGYRDTGETDDCINTCEGRCRNQGSCLKDRLGVTYSQSTDSPNTIFG